LGAVLKSIIAFALGIVLLAGQAAAQNADFDLANATGYPIRELYVSPSKQKSWGNDVLGRHVIQDKEVWKIIAPKSGNACQYDIKIVFDDDASEVEWENFNLCEINKITLTYNRKSGETKATSE
jgi:hypothetical protein